MPLTIIVGLPGSGKTTYMRQIAQPVVLFDDINKDWNTNLPSVTRHLSLGCHVCVSDIMFCLPAYRIRLTKALSDAGVKDDVTWLFFANDVDACIANARARHRKPGTGQVEAEIEMIHKLSSGYEPPPDAMKVYKR